MPLRERTFWSEQIRHTLRRYDAALLRRVAGRLVRPRNQWPAEELIDRCVATTTDVTIIDRRLKELDPAERQLLALVGHSRQPVWNIGNLVELAICLGHDDGLSPVRSLLEAGLVYPDSGAADDAAPGQRGKLKDFDQWLVFAGPERLLVFAHPLAMERAVGEELGLGDCSGAVASAEAVHEADGLGWPLRLAVLWQQVAAAPLRRTQSGDFFKRDLERMGQDPLLNAASAEGLPATPDPGLLAVALAEAEGVLAERDGELRAANLPAEWDEGLSAALVSLFAALPRLQAWNPLDGWRHGVASGSPFPSACLLTLLMLARLPAGAWARPEELEARVVARHPYWAGDDVRPSRKRAWVAAFLFGLAYPLKLVQAARDAEGAWVARLSPLGKWALGLAAAPPAEPSFPQTLLVQPNLEILAYRQGLTPGLIGRLTRFAAWQSLGGACTLQVGPDSVYRGLETGLTFDDILQTLGQHGTRAVPPAVVDSLRTWSGKRDRIRVFSSAALVEFSSAEDLNEALARGFPGVRVAERLAVVASEAAIDYRHFRLTASRDFSATPEKCVEVGDDGVTLAVDVARSDLLLESEVARFAESVDSAGRNGRRHYRLTPASLAAARAAGASVGELATWFHRRTGQSLSPAAVLLMSGGQAAPPSLQRHLVLHVASPELAEGLMQWPRTRNLIDSRLGPSALSVSPESVAALRKVLDELGIAVQGERPV